MRVRIGWPVGTLAACVVGYVAAVAVVPPGVSGVPDGPDAAMSRQCVEAPSPLAPMGAPSAVAPTTESATMVEASTAPPPLRGSRAPGATDGLDWGFVSEAETDGIRVVTRRVFGIDAAPNACRGIEGGAEAGYRRWYASEDEASPAAPR